MTHLQDFLASVRAISADQVLHTEESFEIRIGDITVVGRIDRIDAHPDGTVAIVDYKTGKPRDQENADASLQLSLYAIAAHEKWGYKVGALIFHNMEQNVPVITSRTTSDLLAARDRVQQAAQGIADGIFEARLGIHCNFCAYRSLCPEREKRIPRRMEANTARAN
jgi:RecB family exonuclease